MFAESYYAKVAMQVQIIVIIHWAIGFISGDQVLAFCNTGGYAEEAVAQATPALRIPAAMPFADAAAFAIA